MAAFSTIALVGAAAIGGIAAISQARSTKETAEFNALQAERDAAVVEAEAGQEATRIRAEGRRLRGRQTVQSAASGVTLSGSILDILADDAMEIELQAQDKIRQGTIAGITGREQAGVTRRVGAESARQSILGGISRIASLGFTASQQGVFNSGGGSSTPPKPIRNPRR